MDDISKDDLYIFKAKCEKVVDGDTIDVIIDFGFDVSAKRRVRILDVDTPERGQENFKEATEFVKERVEGKELLMQTYKSDAFGRYLAKIWYINEDTGKACLNDELLRSDLLKPNSRWNNLNML
ncbi:cold shock protein [Staphylococcus phage LY01]|nr:cold shock protein [Staphylococcus phage LY01]